MENTTPWVVINSGVVQKEKQVNKSGKRKPDFSFWVDKNQDIRVAIWEFDNGAVGFQVTEKNKLLQTSNKKDFIDEDDDLPF